MTRMKAPTAPALAVVDDGHIEAATKKIRSLAWYQAEVSGERANLEANPGRTDRSEPGTTSVRLQVEQ
jgi:hypothetical protein